MTKNITTHTLRKLIHQVQQESQTVRGISTATNPTATSTGKDSHSMDMVTKRVTQVQGDTLIAEDGSKAKLLSPVPGMTWVCLGVASNTGVISLEKPLSAYFLSDGTDTVCLGFMGETDEFQLSFKAGENEVRINREFVSITTKHMIINGVEEK